MAAFDPRKNHRYLLDAFDLLWQRIPDPSARPKLCLVGRVGGRCHEIIERIKHHPLLNRNLFAFHDLNDAELQYCYQQCRGVIFPSIVEGFGLRSSKQCGIEPRPWPAIHRFIEKWAVTTASTLTWHHLPR